MSKERQALASQEEQGGHSPWWAKIFQWLWQLGALLIGGTLVTAIANWILGANGVMIPPGSLLQQWLNSWPVTLPIGIILSLAALVVWLLSRWQAGRSAPSAELDRVHMLQKLKRAYRDLLAAVSLENVAPIELEFIRKPDVIQSDADRLYTVHRQGQKLPAGTSIQQIYADAPGGLLMLGDAGAGKSFLLLSLALALIDNMQLNPDQLLPVILPLSTWPLQHLPLQDWCCKWISRIYDVPDDLCKEWLEHRQIILLLDGLDNMEKDDNLACIEAINAYHHEHLMPLVVCSRYAGYASVARERPLTFQDAVVVQPLVYNRVVDYLTNAGHEFDALRSALTRNREWRELVVMPLLLSALMRTSRGERVPARGLAKKEAELLHRFWKEYIPYMVQQKGDKKRYPLKRCLAWLHWLAGQMRAHNQTIFFPERLRPEWLPTGVRRVYLFLAIQVPGALVGGLAGLLTAPLLIAFDPAFLLQYSLLSVFLGIMFSTMPDSAPVSWRKAIGTWPQCAWRLVFSIWLGCMWCIISWLTRNTDAISASGFLRIVILAGPGLVIGLSCFLIIALLPWLAAKQAQITIGHISQNRLTRLWHRSLFHGQYSLFVAIIFGLGIGLSTGIERGVSNGWNYGFSYGLGYGLCYGLSYGLLCVPLRYILTKPGDNVHLVERLGWTWGNLRHSLLTTKNLCIPLAVMSISLLLFGGGQALGPELSQGWDQRLSWGLSWGLSQSWSWSLIWGLSCWLLLGLFQSISRERLDERDCHSFNRGIHDAFRHSLLMSIASALMIGMVSILSWGFSYELSYGLHYGLNWGFSYELGYELNYGLHTGLSLGLHYVWLFALSGGVLAGVLSGGLAVLRHYILRFLLWKTGLFPWNIQPFLMDAVTRVLLLPLDGGYTFTHRLLLEYLADYTA